MYLPYGPATPTQLAFSYNKDSTDFQYGTDGLQWDLGVNGAKYSRVSADRSAQRQMVLVSNNALRVWSNQNLSLAFQHAFIGRCLFCPEDSSRRTAPP